MLIMNLREVKIGPLFYNEIYLANHLTMASIDIDY